MKFSNGCWLDKKGVTAYSPAKVYETNIKNNEVTLYVPHNLINHRGDTLGGPVFTIELSSPMSHVIKVKMSHFTGGLDIGPNFTVHNETNTVEIDENDEHLIFTSGELSATISKSDNWEMSFNNQDGFLTQTGFRNMAYMLVEHEGPFVREQLHLSVGEQIYGLGERFTPFIRNGQSIDLWNEDGGTSTEQSYKNIPFYLSSKGYGVFINHPENVSLEIGSEKVNRVQFSVPGQSIEYYIINGPALKDVLTRYTTLTGKPGLPPAWSFGLWLTTSFTTNYDEATVTSFIDGMAQRNIPLHTFHFDCFWMKAFNWCDFEWDRTVFPDPVGMLKRLKEKGLHICVWINPYIAQQSPLFKEGQLGGYFIKNKDGSVWQWDMWQPGMAVVDFTNPAACTWYESKLERLMDMGVDSFKTDFGERIPTDVIYHDGSDPLKMHNYYTFLYNKVVFDLLEKRFGKNQAVLFARSATVGSQTFPVHWGGDCTSEFESMAESLRGGLSLCLSGFGFWSHDIGGFESTSTPSVYKRWAAFGLLSTHSRLHGSSSYRVPWEYDDEAVDVVRFFSQLKCTLMPYLYGQANQTALSGIPMMRAMILEFQQDPTCHYLDRQYMLGNDLLVAPIFNDTGDVSYYLPKGRWTNYITNAICDGGSFQVEHHDYLSLPLMVRENTLLAVGSNNQKPDYDYLEDITYHLFELKDGQKTVSVYNTHNVIVATLSVTKSDNTLTVHYDCDQSYNLLLRNISTATCEEATVTQVSQGFLIEVPMQTQSLSIKL